MFDKPRHQKPVTTKKKRKTRKCIALPVQIDHRDHNVKEDAASWPLTSGTLVIAPHALEQRMPRGQEDGLEVSSAIRRCRRCPVNAVERGVNFDSK